MLPAWRCHTERVRLRTESGNGDRIDPAARVVYADIDPMVAAQSAPLLAGTPNVTLIAADLRDPGALLGHPRFAR
jgi:hypothetical protein